MCFSFEVVEIVLIKGGILPFAAAVVYVVGGIGGWTLYCGVERVGDRIVESAVNTNASPLPHRLQLI